MPETKTATDPLTDKSIDHEVRDTARSKPSKGGAKENEPASGAPAAASSPTNELTYPGRFLSIVLNIALLLAMFLVALDMAIVATAIPTITAEFHSVDQVGWYGSAFFMTLAAFQASWGKAYKYFPLKIVFLACIVIFEIGSLVVALAPSSLAVIIGRAVQGAGGAGVTGGCYIIAAFITRPKHMAQTIGLFGTAWSCSSVLGPVLGGVFTQDLSWRWCFWVNLPIGGATMVIILLLFKTPAHSRLAHANWKEVSLHFDVGGVIFLLAALTCLLLALEMGGVTRPWSNSVPIGLLVGFVLIIITLVALEWKQGERSMVVFRIVKRRTVAAFCVFGFCVHSSSFARNYNLPIYFQAVQGVSPSESGIRTLPTVLAGSLFSFVGSVLVGKIGYWQPFFWIGSIFSVVGAGLIYTLDLHSTAAHYIGYQVVVSIGTGLTIQIPIIIAQAISSQLDMSVTVSIALFFQFIGATIGVSVATNIMDNVIISSLPANNPNITAANVLEAGSSSLREYFPNPDDLNIVVNAYMDGLRAAWVWSIVLVGVGLLASFFAEWKSLRPEDVKKRLEAKKSVSELPADA
ncbi:uncharacterized protein K452DRAFT_328628 [Aplosporella prunicola CBS 121167]|uniref:Major facilitator superfamily (MFS) profile domain-containing protein n=1 Tax=Aplosporella prunicola CBS 121167 TaxID=1176127 RepID=A0A6A6B3U6_9PEZI|nr:uncharacterized protein K452DRAFT_328628 [Aplosporella prunicola CBS 121167]KAF2138889.1 hypothetical protein K452DRAFT_328628 [Aplosporella prunicola CBS 121167]